MIILVGYPDNDGNYLGCTLQISKKKVPRRSQKTRIVSIN